MEKKLFKSLIALITYAIVLVALIVKLDAVTGWLGAVAGAFTPLLAGFAIAFILNRPCAFFERLYRRALNGKAQKAARGLAAATAYVVLILVITLLLLFVIPELTRSLQTFLGSMDAYAASLQNLYNNLVEKLDLEGALASLDLTGAIDSTLNKLLTGTLDVLTTTLPHIISMTSTLVSAVITGVLALVFSIYMLSGAPRLTAQCRRLCSAYLPQRVCETVLSVVRLTADTFSKYVSGQLTEACILGGLCFLGMCIFRFAYAPLISVVIGVSALIPVAGAYIGAIVAVLLLVMISPLQALLFLVFLVVLQQLEGNIIYPRVVGTSLGLPGIWVLAAVTVGSALLGFAGLIVSVPLAAVAYTLLRQDLRRRTPAAAAPEELHGAGAPKPPSDEGGGEPEGLDGGRDSKKSN